MIITQIGEEQLANRLLENAPTLEWSYIAIGDGENSNFNSSSTSLENEVYRTRITDIYKAENGNIVFETYIAPNIGNFTIREIGIFDEDNNLVAIGSYPETYLPGLSGGAVKSLVPRIELNISNSENYTFLINNDIVLASRRWVSEHFTSAIEVIKATDYYDKNHSNFLKSTADAIFSNPTENIVYTYEGFDVKPSFTTQFFTKNTDASHYSIHHKTINLDDPNLTFCSFDINSNSIIFFTIDNFHIKKVGSITEADVGHAFATRENMLFYSGDYIFIHLRGETRFFVFDKTNKSFSIKFENENLSSFELIHIQNNKALIFTGVNTTTQFAKLLHFETETISDKSFPISNTYNHNIIQSRFPTPIWKNGEITHLGLNPITGIHYPKINCETFDAEEIDYTPDSTEYGTGYTENNIKIFTANNKISFFYNDSELKNTITLPHNIDFLTKNFAMSYSGQVTRISSKKYLKAIIKEPNYED